MPLAFGWAAGWSVSGRGVCAWRVCVIAHRCWTRPGRGQAGFWAGIGKNCNVIQPASGLLVPDSATCLTNLEVTADCSGRTPLAAAAAAASMLPHRRHCPNRSWWEPAAASPLHDRETPDARACRRRSAPRWALGEPVCGHRQGRSAPGKPPAFDQQSDPDLQTESRWMPILKARRPLALERSALGQSTAGLRLAPHQAPGCWRRNLLAGRGGFAPRLNLQTKVGSHWHRVDGKLLAGCAPGPESGHGGGCAAAAAARALRSLHLFAQFQGTGICWFRALAQPASRHVASRPGRRCGPAGQALTVSCCGTIPRGWCYWAAGAVRKRQSGPGPAFPWPGPRSSTPAIPASVRARARSPCDKANRSRQSASCNSGLKFDGKKRRRLT